MMTLGKYAYRALGSGVGPLKISFTKREAVWDYTKFAT